MGGAGMREEWMRADAEGMVELLSALDGDAPRVVAWVLHEMDARTNRVYATRDDLVADRRGFFAAYREDGRAPSAWTVNEAMRTLSGRDGRLAHPLVAMEKRGVYMVSPRYASVGGARHALGLADEFDALLAGTGLRECGMRAGQGGWLKAGREVLAASLSNMRGADAQVAAYLLASMDRSTNTAHCTVAEIAGGVVDRGGMLSAPDARRDPDGGGEALPARRSVRTPRASAVKRSLRLLQGELVAARGGSGKRRIEAPFCLRVREGGHLGPYMVSPAHFFSGSDERGRELRARFRRLQLGQLRGD